ncbi:MAG: RHS repeat-associated core domain-containing protein [Anaerolineae bacterium]
MAFKLGQTNSQAGLEIDSGSGSGYCRVAVYESGGKLYQALAYPSGGGTTYVNPTVLVDAFQANTWYVLEVTANDGAGSRVSVWAESAPNTRYEARWGMPTGQAWTFRGWVYTSGTLLWLDDYREEQGLGPLADVRVAGRHYEYDYATNVQTKRYYAEGTLLATRSIPNANPNAQTLRYVQSDHLGSTSTLTDASGQVVARERYSAFGERRRGEMPLTTDQLYTSQQYNSLSGLYHYSDGKSPGRFYDPLLARFVMADSITPGNGSIALNRYAYSYNNPVAFIDPDGHCAFGSDGNISRSDCSVQEFEALKPEQRIQWMQTFARQFIMDPRNWTTS